MNPLTLEWAQKAERDYTAIALHKQVTSPDFDLICFHAQQCQDLRNNLQLCYTVLL